MHENELLGDFMKQFRQIVLQVKSYNMDVILQILKRSINLDTQFLAKKSPVSIDDLFKRANKYVMLEDDVWVAS